MRQSRRLIARKTDNESEIETECEAEPEPECNVETQTSVAKRRIDVPAHPATDLALASSALEAAECPVIASADRL